MKKLLATTAVLAAMGATGAFAQAVQDTVYEWTQITTPAVLGDDPATVAVETTFVVTPAVVTTFYGTADQFNAAGASATLVGPVNLNETNSLAGNQTSLLDTLLAKADTIQVSLANTSENLANIDGSLSVTMTQDVDPDLSAGGTTGATIIEPLTAKLGNLTTTVIGSLGDGTIVNTSTLANVTELNQAMTATSGALSTKFAADNAGLAQVYNLSSNLGALDASLDVNLTGVSVASMDNIPSSGTLAGQMATWSTTAIGSLGTGAITSTVTNNATGLTERLVGTN